VLTENITPMKLAERTTADLVTYAATGSRHLYGARLARAGKIIRERDGREAHAAFTDAANAEFGRLQTEFEKAFHALPQSAQRDAAIAWQDRGEMPEAPQVEQPVSPAEVPAASDSMTDKEALMHVAAFKAAGSNADCRAIYKDRRWFVAVGEFEFATAAECRENVRLLCMGRPANAAAVERVYPPAPAAPVNPEPASPAEVPAAYMVAGHGCRVSNVIRKGVMLFVIETADGREIGAAENLGDSHLQATLALTAPAAPEDAHREEGRTGPAFTAEALADWMLADMRTAGDVLLPLAARESAERFAAATETPFDSLDWRAARVAAGNRWVDEMIDREDATGERLEALEFLRPGSPAARLAAAKETFGTSYDGSLYSKATGETVRKVYAACGGLIDTGAQLRACLRHGPYTFPGCYPLYFITSDGGALSFDSVRANLAEVISAIRSKDKTGGWQVGACEVNYEDADLVCDHSGERIESAYAEATA
jgi:hypothetical protein